VKYIYGNQNPCYRFGQLLDRTRALALARAWVEAFQAQCDRRKDFFIWIRRNPLISPDSAKRIQGNPSFFSWIFLHFLGFIWIYLVAKPDPPLRV
jgi:hypothetical protein